MAYNNYKFSPLGFSTLRPPFFPSSSSVLAVPHFPPPIINALILGGSRVPCCVCVRDWNHVWDASVNVGDHDSMILLTDSWKGIVGPNQR